MKKQKTRKIRKKRESHNFNNLFLPKDAWYTLVYPRYTMLFLVLLSMFFIILPSVDSVIFTQDRTFRSDNITSRNHVSFFWDRGNIFQDFVKSDGYLESYVWYNIYVNKWNLDNPEHKIAFCNFTVEFFDRYENTSKIIHNQVFTDNDIDTFNAKYFVQLQYGDGYTADIDCKFINSTERLLDMSADMTVVSPTWECQECQYYNWLVQARSISKAKTVGDNTVDIISYIRDLFYLNFQIIIIIFWLILINVALIPISLIFIGVYWVYVYLKNLSKER